ncbi:MAG: hypothetical protein PHP06_07245 [Clostridia bacterium]|nr:hypothetical protein [Clostridia bacterium]
MKNDKIKIGQLVLSKAGRDKGRYFLIWDIVDQDYVKIVDGDLRKIKKPKKKKIKHLVICNKNVVIDRDINDYYIQSKIKEISGTDKEG